MTPPVYQPPPGYPGYGFGVPPAPSPQPRSWVVPMLIGSVAALIVGLLIGGAIGFWAGHHSGRAQSTFTESARPQNGLGETTTQRQLPGQSIPPRIAVTMPAGLLSSITRCGTSLGTVFFTNGGPGAPGVSCSMVVDGMLGEMAFVDGRDQRPWVDEAHATREQRPGFRPITAPGWTAYQFDWAVSGGTVPCTVVINPVEGLYFDFVSRGTPEQAVPFAQAVQRKLNPDVR